jgi:hypothetical protein
VKSGDFKIQIVRTQIFRTNSPQFLSSDLSGSAYIDCSITFVAIHDRDLQSSTSHQRKRADVDRRK